MTMLLSMTFNGPRTRAGSSKSMQAVRVNRDSILPAEWVPIPLKPVERYDPTDRLRAAEYMRSDQIELDA